MADDRYSWLDEETAERLLRGLPVDACDGDDAGAGPERARSAGPEASATPEEPAAPEENPRAAVAGRSARPEPSESGQSVRSDQSVGPDQAGRPGGHEQAGRSGAPGRSRGLGRRAEGRLDVPSHAWFREADRRTVARLAAALDELSATYSAPPSTTAGSTPVELPGEAAALDAFRAAQVGAVRGGVPGAASAALGGGGAPGSARSRARNLLTGRPLRAGFAVALAGCALGGVAVAAGTGVLPTPFSSGDAPAATVSPATSPSGGGSEDGSGAEKTPGRDTAGDRHGGRGRSGGTETGDGGKGERQDGSLDLADSGGAGGDKDGKHGKNGNKSTPDGKLPGTDKPLDESQKEAIAAALCKGYAANKLEADDRRKLERAAGGRAVVRKFCAEHGNTGSGSDSGGSGQGGSSGGSGGDGDGGADSGGSGSGGSDGGSTGGDGDPPAPGDSDGGSTTGDSGATGSSTGSASVKPTPSPTVTGATPTP
ncbi:hypothetical protein ITI46_20470 [Streptomyces oryzae]|uniref:Extensin n=1 Tax=Streptomyces oryzae TaxID=1434886 RepID=A0ABS3XF82_9ACTN|nr:hypothetical protein [Streptomyces oryzae]MBO8194020.1 hypothetical protein [Streptomyces oryzae]